MKSAPNFIHSLDRREVARIARSPLFYTVTNRSTGKVRRYASRLTACRAADRQDLAHGAIICTVKPHWPGDPE